MDFVEINSQYELNNFLDNLGEKEDYPIEFYLGGITYTIPDYRCKLFFIVGAEMYRETLNDI